MPIWRRSKKLQGPKAKRRREIALAHLEHKLISNKHFPSDEKSQIPLDDKNKKRIVKEIAVLKERI